MPEVSASRYLIQAGWDSVPHLSEKAKAEILASTPHHEKKARTEGTPSLGSGAIYPVELEFVQVAPFKIPPHWTRGYGLDVGWKRTCAIWAAHDRDTDTIYLNAEHYRGKAEPSVHAASIKARGEWMPGAIDPASRGRSQKDGEQLLKNYQDQKLLLFPAVNAVEAGLLEVFTRLSTGRLKVFATCQNLLAEYRLYRRDKDGKVIKKFDHAMDAMRYIVMTKRVMKLPPIPQLGAMSRIADQRVGY